MKLTPTKDINVLFLLFYQMYGAITKLRRQRYGSKHTIIFQVMVSCPILLNNADKSPGLEVINRTQLN